MGIDSPLLSHELTLVNEIANVLRTSGLFDADYYQKRYPNFGTAGSDAVAHYIALGAWEGKDPHPLFDTSYYLEQIPSLIETRTNPLWHYLTSGAAQALDPNPYFDTSFYLEHNPDVASNG